MPSNVMISIDLTGITFERIPDGVVSVDVKFDGKRIWSIDLRNSNLPDMQPWPEPLQPYLSGATQVSLDDSATGTQIFTQAIAFTQEPNRVSVTNDSGVQLSLNKWNELAPDLAAIGVGVRSRILDRAEELIAILQELGLRPFVVGGTLLGAVRDGTLLPHDDDADIAYLSEHTHPVDVACEGFKVGERLEELGYNLVRHSATHMQLHFKHDAEDSPYYIDIFAAFFTDDAHINQPFHVRGELRKEQMLPFSTVKIDGRNFPAPNDTNAWLTINYDQDWRIPIPGFEIVTPDNTIRRFNNWFGSFDISRNFWNNWFSAGYSANQWAHGAEWISSKSDLLTANQTLELGAGSGMLTTLLADDSREVIATDFSNEALKKLATLTHTKNVTPRYINLNRLDSIAAAASFAIEGKFDLVANFVLDQITPQARQQALRLARIALNSGGAILATFNTVPAPDLSPQRPNTWHLDVLILARECAELGMRIETEPIPDPENPKRGSVGVKVLLGESKSPITEELPMKNRIARFLKSLDPRINRRQIRQLKEEVESLRQEIDAERTNSLRVAELLNMVEKKLTPKE